MNEFELMSTLHFITEIDPVYLTGAAFAVVLLALTSAIALLWQRQKVQADLVGRLIAEMASASRDKRLQRQRRRFEEALQGAEASRPIEPIAEPQVAEPRTITAEQPALSEGEDRLLQFIRQHEAEPLHEHA